MRRAWALALAWAAAARALLVARPCCGSPTRRSVNRGGAADGAAGRLLAEDDGVATAPWVGAVNSALERAAAATLVAFVIVDISSALCLLGVIVALGLQVPPEFVVAYGISKGLLRAPRLAVDAAVAAALAKRFPSLAAVKISLLVDAASDCAAALKRTPSAALAAPGDRLSRAAARARSLLDEYGLAYMVAKNVIGPLTIAALYAALASARGSLAPAAVPVGAGLEAAARFAGQCALASTSSTLLFPFVVVGAAALGPQLDKGARAAFRVFRGGSVPTL
ncbi:hypothetical protein M885DRAFT_512810 [Pelagophyceae sp. CCMP2097]|nr:hypothetical protein M885DRAFT_512810 [Pelagophyceae sp. CCMP2097]